MSPEEATLDKFEFKDQNQNEYGSDDQEGESDNIEGRYGYVKAQCANMGKICTKCVYC